MTDDTESALQAVGRERKIGDPTVSVSALLAEVELRVACMAIRQKRADAVVKEAYRRYAHLDGHAQDVIDAYRKDYPDAV